VEGDWSVGCGRGRDFWSDRLELPEAGCYRSRCQAVAGLRHLARRSSGPTPPVPHAGRVSSRTAFTEVTTMPAGCRCRIRLLIWICSLGVGGIGPSVHSQTSLSAGPRAALVPQTAAPNFAPPKLQRPAEGVLQQIEARTAELAGHCATLRTRGADDDLLGEVEICLKAARNIVRLEEWYSASAGQWTLDTLDLGLQRASQLLAGQPQWRDRPGVWNLRAYRSQVDGSLQPYAVLLPAGYDPGRPGRVDVVLHGRDGSLTECKFIATHRGPAPESLDHVVLEVYGRGNNAYRWAGETDVFEALAAFRTGGSRATTVPPPGVPKSPGHSSPVDPRRIVLRGFSMGGAGTWHIGLHHPTRFCLLGPGAGFTTTRGYVANLPDSLPPHIEACLHLYDAVDCAENAFHVPVVAYSGEKDPQRQAAVNVEQALRDFPEALQFTHLVAPGLAHELPKEWQLKNEIEYRKYATTGRSTAQRVRFVLYSPAYGECDWVRVDALRQTHHRAQIEGTRQGNTFQLATTNIRRLTLELGNRSDLLQITLDGQTLNTADFHPGDDLSVTCELREGRWVGPVDREELTRRLARHPDKHAGLQGPIDDAFRGAFRVIPETTPTPAGARETFPTARAERFRGEWDRYFRGSWPVWTANATEPLPPRDTHWIVFGDPGSNSVLAQLLPFLPITWNDQDLIVAGTRYDPKTHTPVLIYPNPLAPGRYVVLNSGHTFGEAELRGTNALLYPRLGDWAVLKQTPSPADPHAFEVVAAGLFDEDWAFPNP